MAQDPAFQAQQLEVLEARGVRVSGGEVVVCCAVRSALCWASDCMRYLLLCASRRIPSKVCS